MTTATAPARNWLYDAPLGARVAFLNADDDRRVEVGTTGVVVWAADGSQFGRDVRLDDGRTVNIPRYELAEAPAEHGERCDDPSCCPTGTLVFRYAGGSVRAFDLDVTRERDALRNELRDGADYGDPIADAWHFGTTGEPARVTFEHEVRIVADGRVVTALGYRIDGRA